MHAYNILNAIFGIFVFSLTILPYLSFVYFNYCKLFNKTSQHIIASIILFLISYLVGIVFYLFFIFKKGKVTSRYPYDFTKEFNWGAFFGGWIWGLFNESFKPLIYSILLGWIPGTGFIYH